MNTSIVLTRLLKLQTEVFEVTSAETVGDVKGVVEEYIGHVLYVGMQREPKVLERKSREKEEERRKRTEGRYRAIYVKNYTSAYISPATSGVILAISRWWEPEPGREFFLPFSPSAFSFRALLLLSLSFIPDALFGAALTQKKTRFAERRAFANASLSAR